MRRHLLVIAATALAVTACSASTHRSAPATTLAPAPTTARPVEQGFPTSSTAGQIIDDIRTKGLTPERALLLFTIQVGPLPGVPPHTGKVDPTDFDGTPAVAYVQQVWSKLTPAQRKAAGRLIDRGTGGKATTTTGPPTTVAWTPGSRPRPRPASFRTTRAPAYDYLSMAKQASAIEATSLGVKPITALQVEVDADIPLGTEYAHSSMFHKPLLGNSYEPWGDGCHILVWDQKMQPLTAPNAAAIMAHEVFHCYQQQAVGSGEAVATLPAWVSEGSATWVMAQVVPAGSAVVENKWSKYTFTPLTTYAERSYDAIGVFGHYGDVMRSQDAVWGRLLGVVTASVGGHSSDALHQLIQGSETEYFQQWGASYYEESGQASWTMAGPGSPPSAGPTPEHLTIGNGDAHALTAVGPAQATQTVLDTSADVVVVYLMDGYGRLHDEGHGVDVALDQAGPVGLCLRSGGCACPNGEPGASQTTIAAKGPITIGLDGGNLTAQAGAAGKSLDDFCKKPDNPPAPPPPPPGGGGGGGGGGTPDPDVPHGPGTPGRSTGDPHLTTFDGLRYEFQTVGEFTLVRSTTDDFTVQVRQVAARASTTYSLNQAMATRLGGKRVQIAFEGGREVVRVDGKVINATRTVVGNGTVTRGPTLWGTGTTLTWPDGTRVQVVPISVFALNVDVSPATGRRGKLEGLLGNFDGKAANDLTAGGEPLGVYPANSVVNHAFADHWRLTQAESLLPYGPGKTSASYTDKKFPATAPLTGEADAERVCRDAGVTDAALLHSCVIDLASTNAPLFASMYGFGQAVDTARAAAEGGTSTPSVDRVETLKAELGGGQPVKKVLTLKVKAGDVAFIGQPGCEDDGGNVAISFMAPDGSVMGPAASGCQFGRIAFPTTGTYQVNAFIDAGEHSSMTIPIRFQPHDVVRDVSYGDTLSGHIAQKAAHHIYRFTGAKGDELRLFGPGCTTGGMVVSVVEPSGLEHPGDPCRHEVFLVLPASGSYRVVVNGGDQGPGDYAFVLQK